MPPKLQPKPGTPSAPSYLEAPEKALWREVLAVFDFSDAASMAMLSTAMESHQRARRCRERIQTDGEALPDRWGQLKPHPLLAAERDARAAFIACMKALHLDLGVQP